MDNALVTVSEEATVMTAAQHRARCASLRGGMTPSEAAIIADLRLSEARAERAEQAWRDHERTLYGKGSVSREAR